LVQDLISPLEKQIKEQLADRQTKKPPAAMPSGRGGTTGRVVAKKTGGSYKGTEKGKKRASPSSVSSQLHQVCKGFDVCYLGTFCKRFTQTSFRPY